MAFFSNNLVHDSQLRRKRSVSREKPSRASTSDKSVDEASFRKRSPSVSVSSSPGGTSESHEHAPPLPTPISAGLSRPRPAMPSSAPDEISPAYDQSSTPIPFTKPTKRASPPLFTNLMVDVPTSNPVDATQAAPSPRATLKRSTSNGSRRASPSPSTLHPVAAVSDTHVRSDASRLSHRISSGITGLVSPPLASADLERKRPSPAQLVDPALPLNLPHSPGHKRDSGTAPTTLPTPVSPPSERSGARPEPIPSPRPITPRHIHSRSQSASNSPTAQISGSAPGSTRSSVARRPIPMYDKEVTAAASGSGSASGSGKSTPTRDAVVGKQQEKRTRNVLRKRSTMKASLQGESTSAPASDNEKVNTHRPRSRSVVFSSSSRRNSSGALFDIAQPLPPKPVTGLDLTPAGEILVAYKQSQRTSLTRETFHNSGKLVAIGSSEDDDLGTSKSHWTTGWRALHMNDEGSADEEVLRRGLRRKLSTKWTAKESEGQHEENTRRTASGSAAEFSERTAIRGGVAKRSATSPSDIHVDASPQSGGGSERRTGWPSDGEGRVWEEDVGDWVGKHLRDNDKEDQEVSNSRRLWTLVKRFSSGNLKEKYSPPLEAPPPVPPLPKNFARKQPGMSPRESEGDDRNEMPIPRSAVPETPGGFFRYITSVPSLSIPRSRSTSGGKLTGAHRRPDHSATAAATRTNAGRRPSTAGTTPQTRRSTTTRSSSPSSETTKFFSRSRSSSSSSYGDPLAHPMPSMSSARAGRRITSPREIYGSHIESGEGIVPVKRRPSRKSSTSARSTRETSPTGSATIPSFEAKNAVNQFPLYKGKRQPSTTSSSTSHLPPHDTIASRTEQSKRTSPPPIPQRNPRRPGHNSISVPSLPLPLRQHSVPNVIPIQDSSESEATDGDTPRPRRLPDLGQTPTVSRARPRSISEGGVIIESERYPGTAKSTLTFREMTTTQRHLTEQEKNAKWEDLLKRSDKAGGTLHVGSPVLGGLGLWSDRSSTALSETLDQY